MKKAINTTTYVPMSEEDASALHATRMLPKQLYQSLPEGNEDFPSIISRISASHGLPRDVVESVLISFPYGPVPYFIGNKTDDDIICSFEAEAVTETFDRFLAECKPVDCDHYSHPAVDEEFEIAGNY